MSRAVRSLTGSSWNLPEKKSIKLNQTSASLIEFDWFFFYFKHLELCSGNNKEMVTCYRTLLENTWQKSTPSMSKCAILPTWPSHSLLYLYDSWRMSHKTCCTCYKSLWTLAVKTLGYRRRKTCVAGVKWQAWWMTHFFIFSLFLDSFVNSQEWTLSRSVPELKVVSNFLFSIILI